ncbi:MAG: methyltransferase domain-containing protein [Gammaproteobacteria bacterium]|nr:methyltransferase domain-containing protein [Gammaproteobacteria bacterium]MCP4980331.1 methyltransferase domain-containing protein [Gammaproteobacteria bacterium]
MEKNKKLSEKLQSTLSSSLANFPYEIRVKDYAGEHYTIGRRQEHWAKKPLLLSVKTADAARSVIDTDVLGTLDYFLKDEIDLQGNLYVLSDIQHIHVKAMLRPWRSFAQYIKNNTFQNIKRAAVNVKSHYDIPQEVINTYLDTRYQSYSCGIFEDPGQIKQDDLLNSGMGETDSFDSLEKAQWRKFKDAIDFISPAESDNMLDVGCGYGGQLQVALQAHRFNKIVGWTLSHNQAVKGNERLSRSFDPSRYELNEGDYRKDDRIYDHVMSTGMVSHVGPRGLVPYVRNIRKRITRGGRYLHHALMCSHSPYHLDRFPGAAFNKKYVWPGFHWFTVAEHVRALEQNGFQIARLVNLSPHYAKTCTAWYERFCAHEQEILTHINLATYRAWQVYLAGAVGGFLNKKIHVYRIYCVAV